MTDTKMPANIAEIVKANAILAKMPEADRAACRDLCTAMHKLLASDPNPDVRMLSLEIVRQQVIANYHTQKQLYQKEIN